MENKFLGWRADSQIAQNYVNFINDVLADENAFSKFRRGGFNYFTILEHLNKGDGDIYLSYVDRKYPHLQKIFDKFRENDLVGSPETYDYGEKYGIINPTTLRYIKFAGDIESHFGDLNGVDLVEIGGGYGGLVKVLSNLYKFNSVRLYDLPQAKQLQKKYLKQFNIDANIELPLEELVTDNTLVISNYAWCECDIPTRKEYVEKVISKAKYNYMVVYDVDVESELMSLNGEKFLEKDIFNPCDIFYRKNNA